jgi:hypothetical protein
MPRIIVHGAILSLVALALIVIVMWVNSRIWLQHYPQAIQDLVPHKNAMREHCRLSLACHS